MSSRSWWRGLAIGLVVVRLLVASYVARTEAATSVDFDRFWTIASSTAAPYVAYRVEYTPFAVGLFKLVRPFTSDRATFGAVMLWLAFCADMVAAAALIAAFGWQAGVVYFIVTLPLLELFYNRFDLVPTAAAAVSMAALKRKRPILSATALLIGIAFKLWALPLSALLLADARPDLRRTQTVAFVVGGGVVAAVWLISAGIPGTIQVTTFRGATGWQVETFVGNLIALFSHRTLRYEFNAFRIGVVSSRAIVAWLTIGMEAGFALAWLGTRAREIGATWLCSIGALLLLSPLLSPQFMAWIAPAAAIAWVERRRWPAALAAAALALTELFWTHYTEVLTGFWWQFVVTARNVSLLAMTIAAAVPIVRWWSARLGPTNADE